MLAGRKIASRVLFSFLLALLVLLIPNTTENHAITYTNTTTTSELMINNEMK